MMRRQTIYQLLGAALVTAATACSEPAFDDTARSTADAGYGPQPGEAALRLNATVDGAYAVTRAGTLADGRGNDATDADGHKTDIQNTCLDEGELFYAYFPYGVRVGDKTWDTHATYRTGALASGSTTKRTCSVTDGSRQPYYIETATNVKVAAFYPCFDKDDDMVEDAADGDKIVTENTTRFSVENDQSSTDGYKRSDLMFCMLENITRDKSKDTEVKRDVTFQHKLSKLTVTVTSKESDDRPLVQQIRIVGGNRTVTFNTALYGYITDASGAIFPGDYTGLTLGATSNPASHQDPVTMYRAASATAVQVTASAILPPQTITQGSHLLELVTNHGIITYRLSADATLEAGKNHSLTIDITLAYYNKTVDLEPWTVTDWNEGTDYADVPMGLVVYNGSSAASRFHMRYIPATEALGEFYIAETELTSSVWDAATGSSYGNSNIPMLLGNSVITNTTLTATSGTLSGIPEGWQLALPTKEQWLAAAGTLSSDATDAWLSGNSGGQLHPVSQLAPNANGLYDMWGNAAEWVNDGGTVKAIGGSYADDAADNTTSTPTVAAYRLVLVPSSITRTFAYTGAVQTMTAPYTTRYTIECWGASGGDKASTAGSAYSTFGGMGGYATRTVEITEGSTIYIYVGGEGVSNNKKLTTRVAGGWNGGGTAGLTYHNEYVNMPGGGGATHVATQPVGEITATNDLWTGSTATPKAGLIVVAGGGGGAGHANNNGGYGGGTSGGFGTANAGASYYTNWYCTGSKSKGADGADQPYKQSSSAEGAAGGGGGYIGGNARQSFTNAENQNTGGCGGNSWVGTDGSGTTIAGNASMPAPGGGTETGHDGNGFVRITYTMP